MEAALKGLTLQISEVTDIIISEGEAFKADSEEFLELTHAVDRLTKLANGPMEYLKGFMSMVTQITALRLLSEWNAADYIPATSTISYTELARKLDADISLITRLCWNLVAAGILKQVGTDEVTQTPTFAALSSTHCRAMIELGYDMHLPTIVAALDYFNQNGRKEPADRHNTIYSYAAGDPTLTVWEHMNRDHKRMKTFMKAMAAMTQNMPTVGSYDFHWLLKSSEDFQRALVVDVGGGSGHALEAIARATPDLPLERCVVEDLLPVVEEARATAKGRLSKVSFVAADFHKEQPVKGALVYYIRRCLHDYSDKDCIVVLKQIRDAMLADSKCLIVERIMANPPSAFDAATDIFMATLSGKERTLENFRSIVGQAGLKIDMVYPSEKNDVSIIECSTA